MAQTIAEMLVEIGCDISQFERSAKEVQKDMKGMGSSVSGIAKEMGKSVQGFSDKWTLMSQEMKQAYQESQATLRPFRQDLLGIEHDYFKLAKGMNDYKGTNQDFMNEVAELGKRHKKVTEEMMKNNDFMKQSFIQTVGAMVNRSGQSEKIAANFTKMNNPLYTVNNSLLKVGSNLERMARNGNASVLALKLLGPSANMKELNDMTMLINRGLMRMSMLALGMSVVFGIATVAVGKLAYAINEDLKPATDEMSAVWKKVFEPLATVFGAVLLKIIEFTTWVGKLLNKFNEAHPVLATMIQSFGYLFLGLMVILSPLAIGIGLFGGLQAALSAVWMIIGPFVTGFLAVAGTAAIVAAAIVAVGAALYLLWTKTTWFKDAVLTTWEAIKAGALYIWNAIYTNAIKPAVDTIVSFVSEQLETIRQFWDENGSELLSLATNYFSAIWKYIEMVMGVIKGIFQIVWPIISGIVQIAWKLIETTSKNFLSVLLGIIKVGMNLINGDWSGAWEAIEEIGRNIMNNITSFFEDIDLWQIGRDIIQGFINGIGSMVGSVSKKVREIASLVPKGVKKLLDINSPSRVMMEMGGYTGEGFAEGITGEIQSVKSAMNDMTMASVQSVSQIKNNESMETSRESAKYGNVEIPLNIDGYELTRLIVPIIDLLQGNNFTSEARLSGVKIG